VSTKRPRPRDKTLTEALREFRGPWLPLPDPGWKHGPHSPRSWAKAALERYLNDKRREAAGGNR
jgi:hypothetical protein